MKATNFFLHHEALSNFSHLRGNKKNPSEIFVGDKNYAELCSYLLPNRVAHRWRSHRCRAFPAGHIKLDENVPFASEGHNFDLRTQTICGVPIYFFEKSAALLVLRRRLTAKRLVLKYMEQYQRQNLLALVNFVLERTSSGRVLRVRELIDDALRPKLSSLLDTLSLRDLEDLIKAAVPPVALRLAGKEALWASVVEEERCQSSC